jgi:hypothetical protein
MVFSRKTRRRFEPRNERQQNPGRKAAEGTMKALRIYAQGYDAYLRFIRQSRDWSRILLDEQAACRSPYAEDAELHRIWMEGWSDAAAETYVPRKLLAG